MKGYFGRGASLGEVFLFNSEALVKSDKGMSLSTIAALLNVSLSLVPYISYFCILPTCVSIYLPFLYLQDEANEWTYSSTSPTISPSTSSSPSPSSSSSTSPSDPLPRLRARALELSKAGKWLVAGLRGYAESVNPTMAYDAQARHRLHVASSGYPTTFPYAL